jgi:TANK-binding kinase 1
MQTSTNSKVLIMELCTGGSLYNMLDNPENAFGIPENEFFNVLNDVGKIFLFVLVIALN